MSFGNVCWSNNKDISPTHVHTLHIHEWSHTCLGKLHHSIDLHELLFLLFSNSFATSLMETNQIEFFNSNVINGNENWNFISCLCRALDFVLKVILLNKISSKPFVVLWEGYEHRQLECTLTKLCFRLELYRTLTKCVGLIDWTLVLKDKTCGPFFGKKNNSRRPQR